MTAEPAISPTATIHPGATVPRRGPSLTPVGYGLSAGAVAFACGLVGSLVLDVGPMYSHVGGLLFQAGLWGLLSALFATRATGDGRFGRGLLWTVAALLAAATLSSVLAITTPVAVHGSTWFLLLDACWPLSMVGMAVTGVTIAVVGRYRGLLRYWPMLAESWALVTVPTVGLAGPVVGGTVGAVHVLLGYGVLGLLLAHRPEQTRAV
ncbi:hypothetical protein WHI96_15055 [Pseudonocardia tropica]|uniref:Uncharacterized protein n=1 Tax=Pseudonocardia tropica TaxID=681289 RepID=A0ABV1JW08_9PSEU